MASYTYKDGVRVATRDSVYYDAAAGRSAPPNPQNLMVVELEGALRVRWDTLSDIEYYALYRSTSTPVSLTDVPLLATTSNDIVDSDVAVGITYHYVAVAVDDFGLLSTASNEASGQPQVGNQLPASFVHEWLLDEGTGTTAADNIGTRTLTLGDGAPVETGPAWVAGPYLSFAGGEVLQTSTFPSGFGADAAWSVSLLMRLDVVGVAEEVFWHVGDNSPEVRHTVGMDAGEIGVYVRNSGGTYWGNAFSISNAGITAGGWFLLTATADGGSETANLYLNGAAATLLGPTAIYPQTGQGIHIGATLRNSEAEYTRHFNGDIAWVGMATSVLTATEVGEVYTYVQGLASGRGITI